MFLAAHRKRRGGFTLVEMIVVFCLTAIVLTLLYDAFYTGAIRNWLVARKVEGQMAIRILLTRLRLELKSAIGTVFIEKNGQMMTIPLENQTTARDDPNRLYFSQYEFDEEKHSIVYRKFGPRGPEGPPIEERVWLGGRSEIQNFLCIDTTENEQILFQYYRVMIELTHYDVKTSQRKLESGEKRELITVQTTVYPRRVNMELRIEVPQDV